MKSRRGFGLALLLVGLLLASCTSGAPTPTGSALSGATTTPTLAQATGPSGLTPLPSLTTSAETTGLTQSPGIPTPVAYTTQTPAAQLPWAEQTYPDLGLRVSWPEGWPLLPDEGGLRFAPPGWKDRPWILLWREFDAPLEPAALETYVTQKLKGMRAPGDFRTAKLQVAGKQSVAVWGLTHICLQVYMPAAQRVYTVEFMPQLCAAGGSELNDLGQTFLDGLATTGSGSITPYHDSRLGIALQVPAGLRQGALGAAGYGGTGVLWLDSLSLEVLRVYWLRDASPDQIEQLVQRVIDDYPDVPISRSEAIVGGQKAVKLSNVPGQVASTDFFVAANGRVYRLSIPEYSTDLAQPMLDSLKFVPPV